MLIIYTEVAMKPRLYSKLVSGNLTTAPLIKRPAKTNDRSICDLKVYKKIYLVDNLNFI